MSLSIRALRRSHQSRILRCLAILHLHHALNFSSVHPASSVLSSSVSGLFLPSQICPRFVRWHFPGTYRALPERRPLGEYDPTIGPPVSTSSSCRNAPLPLLPPEPTSPGHVRPTPTPTTFRVSMESLSSTVSNRSRSAPYAISASLSIQFVGCSDSSPAEPSPAPASPLRPRCRLLYPFILPYARSHG